MKVKEKIAACLAKLNKLNKPVISGIIAFALAFSPLQATITTLADELTEDSVISAEETTVESEDSVEPSDESTEESEEISIAPTEVFEQPDYSDYAEQLPETEETVAVTEETTTATEETTVETETTVPATEETVIAEETTVSEPEVVEEVVSNIIAASSLDEYFKLVSELPESSNRLIVETTADLSELNVTSGVYYDGTYILYFDNLDDYAYSMTVLSDNGYNYTVDGTIGLCGDFDEVVSNASINPNATVKVAVIDTGSNLANESYSVIGDDTSDYNGHGTAMSSFILNETDNAYIISIKAIGDDGKGNVSDVYAAVQMAEDMGVDYILMAISIRECGRYDLFKSLVENARAKVVASAGNNGTDAAYYLPANVNGVITVGAIDSNGELQSFSNYGDSVDYYVEAESTSEAASKALGIIIDNRTSELATEYVEPIAETGEIYYKVGSIDNDGNFIVNNIGDNNIYVFGGADADTEIEYYDFFEGGMYGNTYAMNDQIDNDNWSYASNGCYSASLYCIQPFKQTPNISDNGYSMDSSNWDASNNTLFQAALACAPGGDLYQLEIDWWRTNGQSVLKITIPDSFSAQNVDSGELNYNSDPNRAFYAIAHLAASYAYYDEDYSIAGIPDGDFKTVFAQYIAYLKEVRADSDYKNWWAEVYEHQTDSTTYQTIARGGATYAPKNVTVVKTSTNTAIVSNNACYSMAGTTYGLYKTDGTLVHTFTLDASGRTTAYTLQQADGKDLYVQEISAGPGYKLNSAKYTVDFTTVDSNDLITIAVQDEPMSDPISWTLEKEDHNGWYTVTNKTLAGAVFRVDYYDRTDIRTATDINTLNSATPKVSLTLTASQVSVRRGQITINQSTLAAADSSGYFSSFNSLRALPLGTYKVTEVSAPTGYAVVPSDKPLVFYIYDNNGSPIADTVFNDNTIYNKATASDIVMQETPQVGFYAPTKVVAAGSPVITGLHSLNGTKYGIYYKDNDNLVCTITFNASGAVSDVVYAAGITPIHPWTSGNANIELAVGDYYAKEITAGRWFKLDTSTHDFSVTANATTTADLTDESKQPPKLHTTATDADTGTHQLSYKERVTINDEVAYEGLVVGESYTTEAIIYDVSTGKPYEDADGKTYSQKVVITPTAENGKATVTFKDVLVPMTATKLVIFEYLYENQNNVLIATHADLKDEGQTVERKESELKTTATDADTGTHQLSYKEKVTITDEVAFTNLNTTEEYQTVATLIDTTTGKLYVDAEGNTYTQKVVFTPTTANGTVTVTFKDVLVPIGKLKLVVFEDLYETSTNTLIATHADLTDEGQTVERKEVDVKTTATDADNGTHTLTYMEKVNINDKATYTNLNPGETYYFTGTLIDVSTGKPYKDANGNTYTKSVEFTPTTADGYEIIAFTDVLVPFTKTTLVVFEDLYEKTTNNHLATHADLTDKDQTVRRPTAATTATVLNAKEVWLESSEVTTITISDEIAFTGFEIGETYRAEATAFKSDGTQILAAGQPVKSIVVFNPTTEDGTVTVDITISTEGLAEGDKIVIFEKIYDVATDEEIKNGIQTGDLLIARHEDLTDTDQTITLHYRPMTGSVTPSYTVAGCMIVTISAVAIGAWLVIARRKRIGEA